MGKKLTQEIVVYRLSQINANITILGEYTGSDNPLLCKCKKCEHLWSPNWRHLSMGRGCPKCATNAKLTQEFITDQINKINPTIIVTGKYTGSADLLGCECKVCNHQWDGKWKHLSQGHGCPLCGGSLKWTLESIKEELIKNFPDICISDDQIYKNANDSVSWYCKACDRNWSQRWSELKAVKNRNGCAECNPKKGVGAFNLKTAERNKLKWLEIPAILYTIKIFDENEIFYKVGVTTRTTKQRFKGCLPYKYEVINEVYDNLYNITVAEQQYHKENQHNSYTPLKLFDGSTECYIEI
jgi:Zn finger protein HypA/HybF involved in hydrogenase expression